MQGGSRFDTRGYLVRVIFGCGYRVFEVPGLVTPRVWSFPHGLVVQDPSLSDALDKIEELCNLRKAIG